MLAELFSFTAFNVDTLFYVLVTLSSAIFLFVWILRVASLVRHRGNSSRKQNITTLIWTITPAVIIIGLGLLGPYLLHNLQYLP